MVNVAQAYEMVMKNKRAKENKRAKDVEPDGHGEATRSHELYLNKLAFVNPTMVILCR
jgi:hypothetical protein